MLIVDMGSYLLIFHLILNFDLNVNVDDMGATNVIRHSTTSTQVDCLFVKHGIVIII
jgi:hypothetical protein